MPRTKPSDLRGNDIIDSRDVIARLRELESERDSYKVADATEEPKAGWTAQDGTIFSADWSESEEDEYQALKALEDDAAGYSSDWTYGSALIRDSYFETYAQEWAEDIGAIDRNAKWPLSHIDWEAAAEELKADYTQVEFDGETYWVR